MDNLHLISRARVDDRLVNELIGIARGITADGTVTQQEAEYLYTWLIANSAISNNPVISTLIERIHHMLVDGKLDTEESIELMDTLEQFTGERVVPGEMLKATTIPLDSPAPTICFPGKRFCLTGTFAFGTRKECETAVTNLGGIAGDLTKSTDYLVIGLYATDSWAHSSYGRKIEKAVRMKQAGSPIAIIGEAHWHQHL